MAPTPPAGRGERAGGRHSDIGVPLWVDPGGVGVPGPERGGRELRFPGGREDHGQRKEAEKQIILLTKNNKSVTMCAQAAPAKQNKKQKKQPIQLNFSELDDPFLNQKGKALRNIRKKMDKYKELEKNVKTGEVKPNEQQKAQIQSIPQLQEEMNELEALCRLYMESNPNFDKSAPALSQADVDRAVRDSIALVSRVTSLSALVAEDSSLVEISEAERASLDSVAQRIVKM